MHEDTRKTLLPLTLLAAASGARTLTGVAAIAPRRAARLAAVGELVADKLPNIPNRVDAGLLLGRVAAGALVGAMVATRTGRPRGTSALIGGLVALASAHTTYHVRRALSRRLPPVAAALVEDALVVGAAMAGGAMLRSRTRVPVDWRDEPVGL